MCARRHAVKYRVKFTLATRTNNRHLIICHLDNIFHFDNRIFRYFDYARAQCHFKVLNHAKAGKCYFTSMTLCFI